MTTSTTRRALLKAVPTTALVMALPGSAAVTNRTEWQAVLTNFKKTDAAYNAAVEREWAAEEIYYSMRPARPKEGLIIQSKGEYFTLEQADANACKRLTDYEAADKEARDRSGYTKASEATKAAADIYVEARAALFSCPAPDLEAVAFKAAVVKEYDVGMQYLVDDLNRLASERRAA